MSEDIEARVLSRFEERLRESSGVSDETRRTLLNDLRAMDSDREDLLRKLVEERRS